MSRIVKLDPLMQSQIAAGEVVERPASVVKELVENSLDAGARRIVVEFEEAGLSLIRVSDDGCGIPVDDAPLALERFATSKLQRPSDLLSLGTLGFRGEALPSIASVSRTTLETRTQGDAFGTGVQAEEGRVISLAEKGIPVGTTVTVRDLFYNTPARLKFMKSPVTERQAIVETVTRLALAWPSVAITLRTGSNVILQTFGQGLGNALADLFGPSDASRMVPVEGHGVTGFAGLPSLYRRTRDRQVFSVNSRPVRNTSLGWALDSSYAGLLPPKTYAVAVLNLSVPPEELDINVHPAKAEVEFQKDREIRSNLAKAVADAVGKAGFDLGRGEAASKRGAGTGADPRGLAGALHAARSRPKNTSGDIRWELVRELPLSPQETPTWEYLGSLADTYLVAKTPSSLLIIDKHALMESLSFAELAAGAGGSQELLVSEIVRLEPREAAVYEEYGEALCEVGFSSRRVGDRTVMVTAVPLVLGQAVSPESIKEVLVRLSQGGVGDPARALEAARLETAACHASVRAGEPLSSEEARALLSEFWRHPEARTCPHGRPTVREISLKEFGDFFGRPSHVNREQV